MLVAYFYPKKATQVLIENNLKGEKKADS